MPKTQAKVSGDAIPILPDTAPVVMPDLPASVAITSLAQFKAVSHPLRTRILSIIQHQPATAKQIAARLNASTGSIGHHLKLLEEAGLAQVVAKRVTNGIIAKYYTRTGKIFNFDLPPELVSPRTVTEDILGTALSDLRVMLDEEATPAAQTAAEPATEPTEAGRTAVAPVGVASAYPRKKLSMKQVAKYERRLNKLVEDFLGEPADPEGVAVGFVYALFKLPGYIQ